MQFAAFIMSSVSTLNIDKLNLGFQIKSLKNQAGNWQPGLTYFLGKIPRVITPYDFQTLCFQTLINVQ